MNLKDIAKEKKIKLTTERLTIFDFIKKIKKPVDSKTIIDNNREINRATIFRILKYLTEKDVLRKIDFSDSKARYEVLSDDHHHFVCQKCNKIEKIQGCAVRAIVLDLVRKGFLVKKHSFELFGICPNCIN